MQGIAQHQQGHRSFIFDRRRRKLLPANFGLDPASAGLSIDAKKIEHSGHSVYDGLVFRGSIYRPASKKLLVLGHRIVDPPQDEALGATSPEQRSGGGTGGQHPQRLSYF